MIFFHGTTEEHIKNIKKKGLMASTTDQWFLEITNKSVCCLSKRPVSGQGGNPLFFARNKGQNGYLVVVKFHKNILLEQKLIAIFDNKVLDDYVQKHFFIRQEFREIGHALFQALEKYKKEHFNFNKLELQKRPATPDDKIIFSPQDQREYYTELRSTENRFMYQIAGVEFSDEFSDFLHYIGLWENAWKFLSFHFDRIPEETWASFQEKNKNKNNKEFWQNFYQTFSLEVKEPKYNLWERWFSHLWLAERKLSDILSQRKVPEIHKNCQLLVEAIEPQYILACIQITTPSGILPEFCRKTKSGIVQAIWDKVDKILEKQS